jgi:hypothetical protein
LLANGTLVALGHPRLALQKLNVFFDDSRVCHFNIGMEVS